MTSSLSDAEQQLQQGNMDPVAKLGDFGLSVVMHGLHKLKQNEEGKIGHIHPMYAAPELLKGGDYSTSSDVFAFGSIVWELTRWRKVFDDVCCFPFYFLCLSLFVESIVYVGTGIKLEGGDDQRPYLESRNARNRAVSLSLF